MAKQEYGKEGWSEFRKEILQLVMLYKQVKEYTDFDKTKINCIKTFFYLSRDNAIASFFIKVGFVISDGSPTLRNFLSTEEMLELLNVYQPKVQLIRNKVYAHNNKTKLPRTFKLTNNDVEEVYNKIISLSQQIDSRFEQSYIYEWINGYEGIKSLEHIIESSNKYHELHEQVRANGLKAYVEMSITSGELKIFQKLTDS
jgi:hypothetical protein